MKQFKNNFCFFVMISALSITGCNEPAATSEKTEKDTSSFATKSDTSSMPVYDPALDPLTVGAQFSKMLSDTLNIKMYEFTMKPGDSVALHAHPDHLVYVLQGGKGLISFNGAPPQEMELTAGMGFISGHLTDAGKNTGTTTIKLLVADIYRPRVK